MRNRNISWEGFFLAFFILFVVLLGITNALALYFKIYVPWFADLIVSGLIAYLIVTRRPGRA